MVHQSSEAVRGDFKNKGGGEDNFFKKGKSSKDSRQGDLETHYHVCFILLQFDTKSLFSDASLPHCSDISL